MGERWDVLAAIGLGGALGTLLRYGVSVWLPHPAAGFPWSTLLVNVVGCAVIGGFMVVITERAISHRLIRPFLGIGLLGGLTTFSTYVVDIVELGIAHNSRLAVVYLVSTVFATLTAVVVGVLGMRGVLRIAVRPRVAHGRQAEDDRSLSNLPERPGSQ